MDVEPDSILNGDARNVLNDVDSESIHLTVTSPPYNLGIEYGNEESDSRSVQEWTALVKEVVEKTYRVTIPDGKFCVVVGSSFDSSPQDDRYRRISLRKRVIEAATSTGFELMDEIIWYKHQFQNHGDGGPLFGSYPYPPNFLISQQHEYILVFRKPRDSPTADRPDKPPLGSGRRERSKIRREDWREWTQSIWHIEAEQNEETHRAAFPVEIPRRLIRLYSFAGELVLDPFLGSGTTAVAARTTGRSFLGIEQNPELATQARSRVAGVAEADDDGRDDGRKSATPPEEIPEYILDGIDRQNPQVLRAIAGYASRLAQKRENVTLADLEDTLVEGESVTNVARRAEGTVVEKLVPCGKNCDGCPHGPYRYRIYRDDGEVRSEYLGSVESNP